MKKYLLSDAMSGISSRVSLSREYQTGGPQFLANQPTLNLSSVVILFFRLVLEVLVGHLKQCFLPQALPPLSTALFDAL